MVYYSERSRSVNTLFVSELCDLRLHEEHVGESGRPEGGQKLRTTSEAGSIRTRGS
jgi:hypothetical protein